MNQSRKNFLLLAILSASSALVQARISNIVYNKATDATANVDTLAAQPVAGRPMLDPTLADNFTSLFQSKFGLSYLNSADNTLVVVETTTAGLGDRALMKARVEGGAIKLESLAKATPTVTQVENNTVGIAPLQQLTTLQNLKFNKGSGNGQKTVLRNAANNTSGLLIVDNATGNFIQTAVTDGNGTAALGNIDDFIIIGDRIVTGVFQNGETDYDNHDHARIRVLNLAGEQIGVGKREASTNAMMINASNATADGLQGLVGAAAVLNISSMHWDASLQRLFVAFENAANTNTGLSNSVMPFLVGRRDGNDFRFEPLSPNVATANAASSITTFRNDALANANQGYSVPFIRTLHVTGSDSTGTSFDRPYLITQVNFRTSGVGSSANSNGRIFAVPLVNNSQATAENIGKVANVTDLTTLASATPAAALNQLYTQDAGDNAQSDVRAIVGGNKVPVDSYADILNMQVVGQTVLVSTKFGGAAPAEAQIGIWASTAIVQENGFIVGWTPWNRVAGMFEQVFRMHYNENTGQLWTVHGDTKASAANHVAGISIPSFGTGLVSPRNAAGTPQADIWQAYGFGSIRAALRQALSGKIYSTRHFQASRTPGLSGASLYAAGGDGKVFLARTNNGLTNSGTIGTSPLWLGTSTMEYYKNIPLPNNTFEDAANNEASTVLDFTTVGKIYAIEVARSRINTEGWLFAGGENGLAVVRGNAAGDGTWLATGSATGNLNDLNIIKDGEVKKIPKIFGPVVGLAAVNTQNNASQTTTTEQKLLILTKNGLFRLPLINTSFNDANINNIDPGANLLPNMATDEYCLSLEMLSHHKNNEPTTNTNSAACGVVVTTKGLYVFNNAQDAGFSSANVKKQPIIFGGQDISGKIRRVQILPRAPYATTFSTEGDNIAQLINTGNLITGTFSNQVANLLVVTSTLADPASEIFLVPLTGEQFPYFKQTAGCQGTYNLDINQALKAVRIASAESLGGKALAGASLLGLPVTANSFQLVDGQYVESSVDLLGGTQISPLGLSSVSSLSSNFGGSGSLVITDRQGEVHVQE